MTIADHKTLRLCRQVEKALGLTRSGECGDEVLQNLAVLSVEPAPTASRLLVTFGAPAGAVDLLDILERLGRVQGRLRESVGRAINRKRVPDLAFRIAPPGEMPH